MKANGKASKPCLTQEATHKQYVQTRIWIYGGEKPLDQVMISLEQLLAKYRLTKWPIVLQEVFRQNNNNGIRTPVPLSHMRTFILLKLKLRSKKCEQPKNIIMIMKNVF